MLRSFRDRLSEHLRIYFFTGGMQEVVASYAARKDLLEVRSLQNCGLILRVHRVNKPGMPLKAYEDLSAFKLFVVETFLLGAMANLDSKSLIERSNIFEEFKGALSEQFVLQQLRTLGLPVFYWSSHRAIAKIDFLVQSGKHVIPIEVKVEENLKANSFRVYKEKFAPPLSLRTSLSDYREEGWLFNLPLYAINQLEQVSTSILS